MRVPTPLAGSMSSPMRCDATRFRRRRLCADRSRAQYAAHDHRLDRRLYFFAVVHYLDELADRALADYRAKLSGSALTYDELRYGLTMMPAVSPEVARSQRSSKVLCVERRGSPNTCRAIACGGRKTLRPYRPIVVAHSRQQRARQFGPPQVGP